MSSLVTLAAKECCLQESWLNDTIRQGSSRVKTLKIKKASSDGFRIISRPSAELEILQRWLTIRFFDTMNVHDSALAFRKGRSILTNAKYHSQSLYFVRVDFSNFFPSIKYSDLAAALSISKSTQRLLYEYPDAGHFIKQVCFDSKLRLPIGYISSPAISNAVMFQFDVQLQHMIIENAGNLGNGKISRYADDIVFSTDKKGGCAKFIELIRSLVKNSSSPLRTINENKTTFSSKAGGSAIVTGLRVCNDNHVTITRGYKDKIRLMLALRTKQILREEEIPTLRGHLTYVRHVAPAFFSTLCAKYTSVINSLIEKT